VNVAEAHDSADLVIIARVNPVLPTVVRAELDHAKRHGSAGKEHPPQPRTGGSDEQIDIINRLAAGSRVIFPSRCGSGHSLRQICILSVLLRKHRPRRHWEQCAAGDLGQSFQNFTAFHLTPLFFIQFPLLLP
jgi:hypothetical protein